MSLRSHTPDRGASFTEYAAVILLVAAIVASLAFAGIAERVAQFLTGALGAVAEEAPTDGDPTDDSLGGEDADEGDSDDCPFWNPTCWFGGDDDPSEYEQEVIDGLEQTESGREALEYVEENGIDVDYDENDGTCTYNGDILIDTTRNADSAAGCYVHEVDHAMRDDRGERPDAGDYDDKEEYLRAMAEYEGNARIAQIQFLQELRDETGSTERHIWETDYDNAYQNGGEEAVLEAFVEKYMEEHNGASSYRDTWEDRWDDAHDCTEIFGQCVPFT